MPDWSRTGSGGRAVAPRIITSAEIEKALRLGGRIDGSSLVLKRSDARVVFSDERSGVHRPPYLLAGYQLEPFGERWPDETEPHDKEHSWGLREFERLSLAARAALATIHPGASAAGIKAAAAAADLDLDAFPVVFAEDILENLAIVADELGPDQGQRGKAATSEQLAMRGGLQILGCRIRSRALEDGVRLVNARLPISLRFIGCVFECPLLLAHCQLVSLDVSGSALTTLDATGLRASGSVYLRRTIVRTPVSFAAAHIAGSFVGSDAVIAPLAPASLITPVNPDHGMLNLSGATIDNEVALERARIWGGLSLRGAVLGRSLDLKHALIMSPLALLEKRLGDLLTEGQKRRRRSQNLPDLAEAIETACGMAGMDSAIATFLHKPDKPVGADSAKFDINQMTPGQMLRRDRDIHPARISALETLEVLNGETDRWRYLTVRTLLKLGSRALTSSVRADNLKLDGTLNARGLVAAGQFRMKYAEIRGAVRFEGAVLRSADHVRQTIERILKHESTGAGNLEYVEAIEAMRGLEQKWAAPPSSLVREPKKARLQRESDLSAARATLATLKNAPVGSRREKSGLKAARDLADREFQTWRFQDLWTMLIGIDDPLRAQEKTRFDYFNHRWTFGEPASAMNLRDSQIAGDLSFGVDTGPENKTRAQWSYRDVSQPLELYGSILLESLTTGGSILMSRVIVRSYDLRPRSAPVRNRTPVKAWSFRNWLVRTLFKEDSRPSAGAPAERRALRAAPRMRTFQMGQVNVGRDVDLRRSVGVAGVDLENATIGGDLKFSGSAEASHPRDADLPSRFFSCTARAEKVRGIVRLRSCKVGGDARLLFDPRRGPFIDAGMMTVAGQLEINPQIGGDSYQLRSRPTKAPADAEGFWLDACDHVPEPPPLPGSRRSAPGRVCSKCNVVLHAIDSSLAWTIDLSRARATVFAHAPAAWPDPGALTLDGFAYQQVAESGPLHPRQRISKTSNYYEHRMRRFVWQGHPFDRAAFWFVGLFLALVASSFAGVFWRLVARDFRTDQLVEVINFLITIIAPMVGVAILVLSAHAILKHLERPPKARSWLRLFIHLLLGFAVFIIALLGLNAIGDWLVALGPLLIKPVPTVSFVSLFLALGIIATVLARVFISPGALNSSRIRPRAIEYLARQRVLENRFQWRSAGHPVLETYVRAAKVLRDAGRFISANAVEEERLRIRTDMLSWRHHGAAKAILLAVDAFSGYGFRLWRATIAIAVIICSIAAIGHLAAAEGFLVRQEPLEAPALSMSAEEAKRLMEEGVRPACGRRADVGVMAQDCPDFVYAADLLLPFIDLGEADRWRPTIPEGNSKDWLNERPEPWRSLLASLLYLWPSFVGILGLVLTGIVGAAIATRVDAALSRVEE